MKCKMLWTSNIQFRQYFQVSRVLQKESGKSNVKYDRFLKSKSKLKYNGYSRNLHKFPSLFTGDRTCATSFSIAFQGVNNNNLVFLKKQSEPSVLFNTIINYLPVHLTNTEGIKATLFADDLVLPSQKDLHQLFVRMMDILT